MNKIEIQNSKTKLLLLLLVSFVFVILGLIFIISPDSFTPPIIKYPLIIRIVGIVAVLFFGTGVNVLRKLFDKKIGLTIDENGITDNTNATSIGLIDWSDIIEIKTKQIMSTRFLLIFVNNSDKYLDRVNGFKQKLMKRNMKKYGTPLSITSNTLRYNFDELERLIKDKLIEQKEKLPNR